MPVSGRPAEQGPAGRKGRRDGRRRPSDAQLAAARLLIQPWSWVTAPRFLGLENLPADRPLPRPERFYFAFGKPIDTRRLAGRQNDEPACRRLRDRTRRSIEELIAYLLAERERDPDRRLSSRLLHRLGGATRLAAPRKRR